MVGATVLGVFLQGLPPDRRVAMARVASLIRRAARGVRESKRFGLVFYELNGGPLFALESKEKSLTLYVGEQDVLRDFVEVIKGIEIEKSLINFTDLNRLPLADIEKLVRSSVIVRRERGTVPSQAELLDLWNVEESEARVAPPVVRISKRTPEEEAAEAAQKEEAARQALAMRNILKPTRPKKTVVKRRAEARANALKGSTTPGEGKNTDISEAKEPARKTARKPAAKKSAEKKA